jgi:hypothetical protein
VANKKTAAELRAENRLLRGFRRSEGIASVINNLVRFGALAFVAWCGMQSVNALAGETTTTDIGIKILTDIRISTAVAWLFGGTGIAYGTYQRKLRRDNIERLTKRTHELERRLDPKRSSSGLTARGETPPEDET